MTPSRRGNSAEKRRNTKDMDTNRHRYPEGRPQRRQVPSRMFIEEYADIAPAVVASDSDPDQSPHSRANVAVRKNMTNFQRRFPTFQTDRARGLMFEVLKHRTRYLPASILNKYSYVNPAFYHPNVAVRDITTADLMAKLGDFTSVNDRTRYAGQRFRNMIVGSYIDCFEPMSSESSLGMQLGQFIQSVVLAVRPLQTGQSVKLAGEKYAAASGFLCKQVSPGRFDLVDRKAGYLGRTDHVMYFGTGQQQKVFAAIELKNLQTPDITDGHRWFTVSGALLAQTLQSMFGHDAPVALAFTEQGFKVYFKEEVDEETLLYCWPPGQHFHRPSLNIDDEGLLILADIIRIATRDRVVVTDRVAQSRNATAPSTPNSPISGSSVSEHESEHASSESPIEITRPAGKRPRILEGDKLFRVKATTGKVLEVTRLSVADRFTEKELREISELEDSITYAEY